MSQSLLDEAAARRNVNYLAGLDFIISLGFGLIMPMFPLYTSLLEGGDTDVGLEIGILFSSFVFTRAVMATPFGNLSDRLGRKRIILAGSFLYAFLAVLFTVPDSWLGLVFVRGLQGVASAMVWPVSEALVIDSSPVKMRGASIGKIVMAANLGMVVGPFIGAALFSMAQNVLGLSLMDSYKFPFYFTALLSLGGAVLVWANVTDAIAPSRAKSKMSIRSLLHPEGMDRQGARNLRILYANALMEGFAFASVGPLLALFLVLEYPDLAQDSISTIIGVAMGVGALAAFPSGRLSDKVGRKSIFVVSGYIAFAGVVLIPFAWTLAILIAFMAMRSFAWQVSSPALRALQADTVPENVRGRLIGTLESMSNLGSMIGAPLGGVMLDHFYDVDLGLGHVLDGSAIPFILAGGIGMFTISLVMVYVKERVASASVPAEPEVIP
ncbi:MAG: MFS transporter [Candidatus Thermoplasmatota archaeon]